MDVSFHASLPHYEWQSYEDNDERFDPVWLRTRLVVFTPGGVCADRSGHSVTRK